MHIYIVYNSGNERETIKTEPTLIFELNYSCGFIMGGGGDVLVHCTVSHQMGTDVKEGKFRCPALVPKIIKAS